MKVWDPITIRKRIAEILPEGRCVPRHNSSGHFYEVIDGKHATPPVYPSVTGKLQVLKDESLINYKMNQAIRYVFSHYKEFTDANVMEHLSIAERVTADVLQDAGDVGTRVHNLREKIFQQWIDTGVKPKDFLSFIPPEEVDVRVISALRALQAFVDELDYIPVACELLLYSHEYKVGGTLDDLGLMRQVLRESVDSACNHLGDGLFGSGPGNLSTVLEDWKTGKHTCVRCGYQYRYQFILMDLKTSNQFKDHYFFQVAIYWKMFWKLAGLGFKPERCIIVKVSKEDGRYKIEDLKQPAKLAMYAGYMIKTNEAISFIKNLRKDNQKVVAPTMQL